MPDRTLLALGLSGLILLLAGCASHSPPRSAIAAGGHPAPGQGYFKIGAPYEVGGVWYTPREDWAYDETGIASWYGEQFHGRYTANGEIFNLNDLTAAHPTLPLPSIVQVTNLDNGRSIDLRVNDRGPYVRGRILDVSRRAAQLLGFEMPGTAKVRVKLLAPETQEAQALARRSLIGTMVAAAAPPDTGVPPGIAPVAAATPTQPELVPAMVVATAPATAAPAQSDVVAVAQPPAAIESAALPPPAAAPLRAPPPARFAARGPTPAPLLEAPRIQADVLPPAPPPESRYAVAAPRGPVERIQSAEVPPLDDVSFHAEVRRGTVAFVKVPARSNIYVQAGAFAKASNARQLKERLVKLGITGVSDATPKRGALYRVRIGPVPSVDEADRLLGRLVDNGLPEARIVVD